MRPGRLCLLDGAASLGFGKDFLSAYFIADARDGGEALVVVDGTGSAEGVGHGGA